MIALLTTCTCNRSQFLVGFRTPLVKACIVILQPGFPDHGCAFQKSGKAYLRHKSKVLSQVHFGMRVQPAKAADVDVSTNERHPQVSPPRKLL